MPARTTTQTIRKTARPTRQAHPTTPKTAPTPTLQPWLRVDNVEEACAFYQSLGFQQTMALPNADGTWNWAMLRFGNGGIQLSSIEGNAGNEDPREQQVRHGPRGLGCTLYLQVPNVEETYRRCNEAGLQITSELRNEFWGDRVFSCVDRYGYEWMFATTYRAMTPDQIVNAAQNH